MFTGTARYAPIAVLGHGSMGVVYRVHDAETDTEVALKTLGRQTPEQLYQLKQEFRVLAGITHRNLVELYDLVVEGDDCFFTMELVEGVDFAAYVRADSSSGRVVAATMQLAQGLAAVHAAARLHRDIKASNVLVTAEGRVVLLDFGLATVLGLAEAVGSESNVAGTFAYMAPELAWGKAPAPAADWYSVGVMLYEALAGKPPFSGPPAKVLQAKIKSAPPPPSTLVPGIPPVLDALVSALLQPEPTCRPGVKEILEQLITISQGASGEAGAEEARSGGGRRREAPGAEISVTSSYQLPGTGAATPFVGRTAELAQLAAILAGVRAGQAAVVHLLGPSGIGKSELARRFLANAEQDAGALALRGRCHPQEAVPYKALDRLIDGLSRVLCELPQSDVARLAPAHAGALSRLFPVLARVPALTGTSELEAAAEPHEIRRRGFSALRELLAGLAQQRPLILWIDDLQWSDLDSAALLRELLRPPAAPAMLVLLSYRSEDRSHVPLPESLAGAAEELPAGSIHQIDLGPLAASETRELAQQLCTAQLESDRRIAEIVAESAGSPLFIGELARWLCESHPELPSAPAISLRLADVMTQRLRQLPAPAREVLEVVSVAGGPVLRSVALAAAGVGERGRPLVYTLEHQHFLRLTTLNEQAAVEVYHDRVREALIEQLVPDRRRGLHRQIAETLKLRPEADAYALFAHYLGAGDTTWAGHYAVLAGDHAAQTLAFERATELYRQALELRGEADTERPALLVKLAEALANGGRGAEAAPTFEAAAAALAQRSADRQPVLELERRAAELYLRTGHLDRGVAIMRAVLSAFAIRYPDSPGRALAEALLMRVRLACRGLRFRVRAAGESPLVRRQRLEACWAASSSFAMVDEIGAEWLGLRHLLDALRVGDPVHVARALGQEAGKTAQLGSGFFQRRCDRLVLLMEELVHTHGGAYDQAYCQIVIGVVAYQRAQWREVLERCSRGLAILRAQCRGVAWEIATAEAFLLSALAHRGEFRELALRLPLALADADARGDLYPAVGFRNGVPNMLWLAQDQPRSARQQADEGMARWPKTQAFHIQHYLHVIARVQVALYEGDAWLAWAQVAAAWPNLRQALFLAMSGPRVELRNLRARAALAAALACGERARTLAPPDPAWSRVRLLKLAAADARRIRRDTSVLSSRPFALLIEAQIADAGGQRAQALDLYAQAAQGFAAVEMGLFQAVARYRCGALRGGEDGRQIQSESLEWMREQGIRNPPGMMRLCAPDGGIV